MEEDEQLSVLMRGLRGQNLNDSVFADDSIQLRLVEVTILKIILTQFQLKLFLVIDLAELCRLVRAVSSCLWYMIRLPSLLTGGNGLVLLLVELSSCSLSLAAFSPVLQSI